LVVVATIGFGVAFFGFEFSDSLKALGLGHTDVILALVAEHASLSTRQELVGANSPIVAAVTLCFTLGFADMLFSSWFKSESGILRSWRRADLDTTGVFRAPIRQLIRLLYVLAGRVIGQCGALYSRAGNSIDNPWHRFNLTTIFASQTYLLDTSRARAIQFWATVAQCKAHVSISTDTISSHLVLREHFLIFEFLDLSHASYLSHS